MSEPIKITYTPTEYDYADIALTVANAIDKYKKISSCGLFADYDGPKKMEILFDYDGVGVDDFDMIIDCVITEYGACRMQYRWTLSSLDVLGDNKYKATYKLADQ